jgi:hypothetical protein
VFGAPFFFDTAEADSEGRSMIVCPLLAPHDVGEMLCRFVPIAPTA